MPFCLRVLFGVTNNWSLLSGCIVRYEPLLTEPCPYPVESNRKTNSRKIVYSIVKFITLNVIIWTICVSTEIERLWNHASGKPKQWTTVPRLLFDIISFHCLYIYRFYLVRFFFRWKSLKIVSSVYGINSPQKVIETCLYL